MYRTGQHSYVDVKPTYIGGRGGSNRGTPSCGGLCVGLLLILLSFPVLWYNEGRAVNHHAALEDAKTIVVDISAEDPSPADNGKLVYFNGNIHCKTDGAVDEELGVVSHGTKLTRSVEVFQWNEKKTTRKIRDENGSREETYYDYYLGWSKHPVDSNRFRVPHEHYNPPAVVAISSHISRVPSVSLGKFSLSDAQLDSLHCSPYEPRVDTKYLASQAQPNNEENEGNTGVMTPSDHQWQEHGLYLYPRVTNVYSPQVGDVRVSFKSCGHCQGGGEDASRLSVLAKQMRGEGSDRYLAGPFTTRQGVAVEGVLEGDYTALQIIEMKQTQNMLTTWGLRLLGFVMMWIGLGLSLSLAHYLASYIPILGSIFSLALSVVTFLLASSLSLIVMAVAWLAYRPTLAFTLLSVAFALLYFARKFAASHSHGSGPETSPPVDSFATEAAAQPPPADHPPAATQAPAPSTVKMRGERKMD